MAKSKQEQNKPSVRALVAKWGEPVVGPGWTGIPNILIEKQRALRLSPTDLCILLHLMKHWWVANEAPYPSKRRIAQAIGRDPRTVQLRISKMEELGYLRREERREGGSKTNYYYLDGLVGALKPYAEEAMQEIERHKREKSSRLRRDKPFLRAVD